MTAETYVVDKSTWGPGEWQDEPDRVDFVHAGFACFGLRHPRHGFWCGYVGVSREHPLYGKEWSTTPEVGELPGNVDYSAACDEEGRICHTPAPGMPADVWWFGFSCSHAFDLCPGSDARTRDMAAGARERGLLQAAEALERTFLREVYRTLPYVRHMIERLADELAAVATP